MKVFGTDCLPVPIHKILLRFTPNKCPSLKDKPKIFFVQACQGGRRDEGKLRRRLFLPLVYRGLCPMVAKV